MRSSRNTFFPFWIEHDIQFPKDNDLLLESRNDTLYVQSAVNYINSSFISYQNRLKYIIFYTLFYTFTRDLFTVAQILDYPFELLKSNVWSFSISGSCSCSHLSPMFGSLKTISENSVTIRGIIGIPPSSPCLTVVGTNIIVLGISFWSFATSRGPSLNPSSRLLLCQPMS